MPFGILLKEAGLLNKVSNKIHKIKDIYEEKKRFFIMNVVLFALEMKENLH